MGLITTSLSKVWTLGRTCVRFGWKTLKSPTLGVANVLAMGALSLDVTKAIRGSLTKEEDASVRSTTLAQIVSDLTGATNPGDTWNVLMNHFAAEEVVPDEVEPAPVAPPLPYVPHVPGEGSSVNPTNPQNGFPSTSSAVRVGMSRVLEEVRHHSGALIAARASSKFNQSLTTQSYPINAELYRLAQLLGLYLALSKDCSDPDGGVSSTTVFVSGLITGLARNKIGDHALNAHLEYIDGNGAVNPDDLLSALAGINLCH